MKAPARDSRWSRLPRPASRWVVLVAAVVLAWPLRQESSTSVYLPALSPFIAVSSAISVGAVGELALLALPVLLLGLIFPRCFCRNGCPVGLMQEVAGGFRLNAPGRPVKWPAVGQWLVLLTVGGAVLGYPLFLWLDPLAIFNGFLNACRKPMALATLLTGLGLPLLLLIDLAVPRLWCQYLCPLGATQDLLTWLRRRLQTQSEGPGPACGAGTVEAGWGRRWFVAALAGAAGALAARALSGSNPAPLRPPGSVGEDSFTGVCVRCGNCAQACPPRIIQPDFGPDGVLGFLTPRLCFDRDYCREDCHRCNTACPSGAIERLSLADKRRRVIGQAVVDLHFCLLARGGECTACIRHCPYQAINLHSADGGFSNEPKVIPDLCKGCGACETVCPTRPVRAVRIHPRTP
jgi:Pyruvate/2-oxoacid:ferredoxin oxidoreductase delta subunit